MRRGRSWRAIAVLMAATTLAVCERSPPTNVILVSIDTLRRDRLNCYGYQARRLTPHLDALAADSVLFESEVASSPWTTPSHMSLLTSLAPSSHGVITPFFRLIDDLRKGTAARLPDDRVTLAEVMASRGYATAAFTGGGTMDPALGFGQGFAVYDVSMAKLNDDNMGRMKAWIAAHRDEPFFLFWHTFEVHQPYLHTRFVHEVVPEDVALEVEAVIGEVGRHYGRDRVPPPVLARLMALRPHYRAVSSALYDGGVLSADRWVGRLLGFLRKTGLYDRTMVVFTSDHGEELWDRAPGSVFGKHGHTLYEEMVGVPLLIKLPGQAHAGTRVAPPTPAIDVMPTILDVLRVPTSATGGMEGRSLRPLWEGRETEGRIAVSEALAFDSEQKSLRSGRYKYILEVPPRDVERHGRRYLPENPQRQLFDLRTDPGERTSLLAIGARPAGAQIGPAPAPAAPPEGLVEDLDQRLRQYVARHFGNAEKTAMSPEMVEKLRSLGYVE